MTIYEREVTELYIVLFCLALYKFSTKKKHHSHFTFTKCIYLRVKEQLQYNSEISVDNKALKVRLFEMVNKKKRACVSPVCSTLYLSSTVLNFADANNNIQNKLENTFPSPPPPPPKKRSHCAQLGRVTSTPTPVLTKGHGSRIKPTFFFPARLVVISSSSLSSSSSSSSSSLSSSSLSSSSSSSDSSSSSSLASSSLSSSSLFSFLTSFFSFVSLSPGLPC